MGQTGGKGRAIIEDVGRSVFCLLQRLLKDSGLLPEFKDLVLRINKAEFVAVWISFHLFCFLNDVLREDVPFLDVIVFDSPTKNPPSGGSF